jgi:glucose-6-phosphate 1-epimerase
MAELFDIPGALRWQRGPDGLTHAVISTPAADAELYLQGAHMTGWTPHGQKPVLFLSPRNPFVPGKAIRGGVPIIFPWFGPRSDGKPGPDHGFARITEWTLESARVRDDGTIEIFFVLESNDATRALFAADFRLRFRVTIGSQLEMELETHNLSTETFRFEAALHTYLAVSDVCQASVTGLERTVYIDKTDGFKRKSQDAQPLRIAKETDQVHVNTNSACIVDDPAWNRRIVVEKAGSESTVIWNPWIEKTKTMSDMDPDGWKHMICVEAANVADNAVQLPPGGSHKMSATLRVE